MAMEDNKKLCTAARCGKLEGDNGAPSLIAVICENRKKGLKSMEDGNPMMLTMDDIASLDYKEKPIFKTALYEASWKNHTSIVKMLIDKGAKVDEPDYEGRAPLHEAAYYGHVEVMNLLIKGGADVNLQDNHGQTPIFRAVAGERLECVEFLVNQDGQFGDHRALCNIIDKDKCTPQHLAAFMGDPTQARWLMYRGAVKNRYNVGWTKNQEKRRTFKVPKWDPPMLNTRAFQPGDNVNITFTVNNATQLGGADGASKSDPFIVIMFAPNMVGDGSEINGERKLFSWKSKTVQNSDNPTWDEKHTFELRDVACLPNSVAIEVLDADEDDTHLNSRQEKLEKKGEKMIQENLAKLEDEDDDGDDDTLGWCVHRFPTMHDHKTLGNAYNLKKGIAKCSKKGVYPELFIDFHFQIVDQDGKPIECE